MKKLIPAALLVLLAACNPGSTSSDASQHNEDSLHQIDHTGRDMPDTAVRGAGRAATTGPATSGTMTELMDRNMQQMMDAPSLGNNDLDFAAQMRIHHQGAVAMAQLELAQGRDAQLRSLAEQMIRSQQAEIAQFDRYLSGRKHSAGAQPSAFYTAAHASMQHPSDGNNKGSVDEQFARLMIPHHQSGVQMAEQYVPLAKDDGLKKTAQNISSTQKKEIATLESWLKQRK